MKIIRNILITVMLIGIVVGGIFVKNGYDMYKNCTTNNYIYSNSSDDVYRAVSAVSIDTVNQKLMVRGRYWGMSDNSSINLSVSAIPEASNNSNGLLSIADKTKLDSIDVASIISRITALETQMGAVSAKLDSINGETA